MRLGPAMRSVLHAAETFARQQGRRPTPLMGDELGISIEEMAVELMREIVRELRVEGLDAEDQDALAEYVAGRRDGYPLLFIDEYEPELFGFRLVVHPSLQGKLKAEREDRYEFRLDPDYKAARERGRGILGLSRILGSDGRPFH